MLFLFSLQIVVESRTLFCYCCHLIDRGFWSELRFIKCKSKECLWFWEPLIRRKKIEYLVFKCFALANMIRQPILSPDISTWLDYLQCKTATRNTNIWQLYMGFSFVASAAFDFGFQFRGFILCSTSLLMLFFSIAIRSFVWSWCCVRN